jgi:hypothetical protein
VPDWLPDPEELARNAAEIRRREEELSASASRQAHSSGDLKRGLARDRTECARLVGEFVRRAVEAGIPPDTFDDVRLPAASPRNWASAAPTDWEAGQAFECYPIQPGRLDVGIAGDNRDFHVSGPPLRFKTTTSGWLRKKVEDREVAYPAVCVTKTHSFTYGGAERFQVHREVHLAREWRGFDAYFYRLDELRDVLRASILHLS